MPYYTPGGYGGGRGSNLPFDHSQPNRNNFIQNPPRIGVNLPPDLIPYGNMVIDALIETLMSQANQNALRTFAFNFYGDRGFTQPQFITLVETYGTYVDSVCASQQMDPEVFIGQSVNNFVGAASAILTLDYPEITHYMPAEAEEGVNNAIAYWEQEVKLAVRRTNRASYGGARGMGGGGGGFTGGLNSAWGNPRGGQGQGGGYGRGNYGGGGGQVPLGELRPSWEIEEERARQLELANNPTMRAGGFNGGMRAPAPVENRPKGIKGAADVNPAVEKTAGGPRPDTGRIVSREGAKPFDRITLDNGSILEPGFKSMHKAKYDPASPPQVYLRESHMHFHLIHPNGAVEEVVQEKTEGMNYLDHELSDKLKRAYKANTGVFSREPVEPEILKARRLVPTKEGTIALQVSKEKLAELTAADAPTTLTRRFLATSLADALYKAKVEAMRQEDESPFLEFVAEEAQQYCFDKDAMNKVMTLRREAKTFAEFAARVMGMHERAEISDQLVEILDKRMTALLNRFNAKQLFITIRMDSFFADIEDLSSVVEKKYGEEVAEKMDAGAAQVIAQACTLLTGKELSTFVANMPEEVRKKLEAPAVFAKVYSVTQLPWTLFEMESQWRLEGVVSPTLAKPMYDALDGIFTRTSATGATEWMLLTADEKPIYAYRSGMVKGAYVVTTEPVTEHDWDPDRTKL